jgi:small subunit ribosomal protein S18
MATLQQSASGKKDGDIRYLTPLNIETNKQKSIVVSKIWY